MPNRPSSNPQQFIQQAPVLQVNSVFETTNVTRTCSAFTATIERKSMALFGETMQQRILRKPTHHSTGRKFFSG